jgi:hypothetical protein
MMFYRPADESHFPGIIQWVFSIIISNKGIEGSDDILVGGVFIQK